jgi:LPS-assembly protein
MYAQTLPDEQVVAPLHLRPSKAVTNDNATPALVLGAQRLSIEVDQQTTAEGAVELRYGELLLRSDKLRYDQVDDLADAQGNVEVNKNGNVFKGPSLKLYVNRFEGEFLQPTYFFSQTGGGGHAARVTFSDAKHLRAEAGTYSSCPVVPDTEPAWQITARSMAMDFEANEGVATGAVLRFLGVPILAAPALSFSLGGARKSGWLPPDISLDSRSGFEFGLPYYWNIAPQRDATFTPFVMTRRGPGIDSEFRFLETRHAGRISLAWLPKDQVANRSRWAFNLSQDGEAGMDWRYRLRTERVSDDDYWKDMPRRLQSQTQRLLASDWSLARKRELSWGDIQAYARIQRWQALQGTDTASQFETPYQRTPQIGIRVTTAADDAVLDGFRPWGRKARIEGALELEYNRFDLSKDALPGQLQTGQRVHMLGHLSAPFGGAAWWLIPRVSVNAAGYALDQAQADGRKSMSRVIPTFSLDQGWVFERDTRLFGTALRQTLEPRLLYVNTPFRAQQNLPNFDAAAKDFNFDSIYTDNQFSGVDRVNDANQLSVGATSRWVNPVQGEEVLRLGLVQRFQFRDQLVTTDGQPVTQRFSDLLLLGAARLNEQWWADGAVQLNAETGRSVRSVMRARYSPGPFRTVSMAYRLARGQSEQIELAWQWPLFGQTERRAAASSSGGNSCGGAWYSAGRVQYSLFDKRLTDSVLGVEYDAGCWLMRVGIERRSTGLAETNTRLMLQLELVGLSQLGSNALNVLRDNIPGYRRLSSDRSGNFDASP